MGGGTTNLAAYGDKQIIHTAQIPIGGLHVTRNLAIGLSATMPHAERLKTLYGNVEMSRDDDREMVPVPIVGDEENQMAKVPRSMIVRIIRPRIEETFEYITDRIDAFGLDPGVGGNRIVLTGGACQIPGLGQMAARMFDRPLRLGRPAPLRGVPELASGLAFATALGLLSWAAGERGGPNFHLEKKDQQRRAWLSRFFRRQEA